VEVRRFEPLTPYMPCASSQFAPIHWRPWLVQIFGMQFADVRLRPHVIVGVAKGVAKGMNLHIVQGVRYLIP
jgi:hypothetical protein